MEYEGLLVSDLFKAGDLPSIAFFTVATKWQVPSKPPSVPVSS